MADIRISPNIRHRIQFGTLCVDHGLLGVAAEVGVHRGDFSAWFLHRWPGKRYLCIDHYEDYTALPGCPSREADKHVARCQLARFGDRVDWIEKDSAVALSELDPGSLDFVYVDALHEYWSAAGDIDAAWLALKPGGILAGHDFDCDLPGVVQAVIDFANREGVTVWLTSEPAFIWSWFCFKPQETK